MKMMKSFKKMDLPFVIFLIIALLICVLATMFSAKDIQHSSYLERAKSLNLVMSKMGDHLNVAFESKWNTVHSLTTRIERLDIESVDGLTSVLKDIYVEAGKDFKVVDDKGIAYYHNGRQEHWKDYIEVSNKKDKFILSPLQFGVSNENYMKYIVPLKKPLVVGDVKIMYTVLTEPLRVLHKDFDTSNYGENCLSFIIDKSGRFIYENGSGDRMANSYNLLAYLEKTVEFRNGEYFANFKKKILDGGNDTELILYNGENYYMSHFNLAMEDWVSIMLVPEQNTQAESQSFTQKLLGDISIIFLVTFMLFIIGFLYMWKKNITKQRLAAEAERRSNEAKTNFLSSMSHDIRTPMNAIIGMTEIALNSGDDVPKPVLESLEKIRLSSAHLLMLINDILDISKIESGRMSLSIAEFSIVEATNTLANLIRPLAKEKNIDLRIHTYNYRQERLLGDELRISQVCINLATNAIKYTPSGGRVDIDFKQDFLEDMPNKVRMTLLVRDNGIGMSEEFQKAMYEVFSRATDSRVNKVAGSGLGLPICKKMVQMMDGTLQCESKLGQGTTFTATLIMEKGVPDKIFKLPQTRILVVDKDTVSTDALERIFKRLGVDFDIINDPAELPSILKQNKIYQGAFVELGVPENGGIYTVQMLRKHYGEEFPIVLTDIAEMALYSDVIAAEKVELTMNKPYFYRIVYEMISKMLKRKQSEEAVEDDGEEHSIVGMKVLVAEDNDLNWEIMYKILSSKGVNVYRAVNGKECVEALSTAEQGQYEAVLMDVRMPIMNGQEAAKAIRNSEKSWLRSVPIIAMTADAFAEDINQCMEAGMDAHLAKPINISKLLAILSNIKGGNKNEYY